jgi:hypothetical protein
MFAQVASGLVLFLACVPREAYAIPLGLPPISIPKDLSTPVAQRVAFKGPAGRPLILLIL